MATVRILRSSTAGNVPSSLVAGQIAINEADGKLFYRNGSGVVTQLATGGGTELFAYANTASFPGTGSTTALYLSISSGRLFQWNGSVYAEVGPVGGSGSIFTAATVAGFPEIGSSAGVIYLATDTARTYLWQGAYIELGVSGGGGTDTELRALFTPAAPTSVTPTAGNAQVSLAWTAPAALSTLPITNYTVQFSSNSGASWSNFTRSASAAASATVTGLTNGTPYVFRVSATNAIGTGNYSAASTAATPAVPNLSATLTSGGGLNSWRWNTANGYFDSEYYFGRWDDNTVSAIGWRTTWTPASKPTVISSAVFTLPYTWNTISKTAFDAVLRGAKLSNAGQGLQGTSPTTASATGSVTTSNGNLTVDCTAVIAEIVGQAGWTPGSSIVLYLSGENAASDREIRATDTAGSLVISYA